MVDFSGFHKPGRGIVPATALDLEELEKVREGKLLRVTVKFDRSSPHNRWFHKLLNVVAEGLDMHPNVLKQELKYRAGLIERIYTSATFGAAVELKSTAFAAMDETDFTDFRRLAIELLFKEYLPGVRRADVFKQVEELTGEKCPW